MTRGLRAIGRRARVLGLLVVLSLCAIPATAQGVLVDVEGHALSYEPVPGGAPAASRPKSSQALLYHGGPVMTSNTNYTLYWAPSPLPSGASEYPAGYQAGLNRYFEVVAHDSGSLTTIDSVLAQYTQTGGAAAAYNSHFGGALLDTDPYPANGCTSAAICLTDEQLRNELRSYISAHGLPADLTHQYFILTPPGVQSCSEAKGHQCSDGAQHPTYCAYHSWFTMGAGVVVYAHDPYVGATSCDPGESRHPNGNQSDATIAGGMAHEHAEAVTDPELNAWYDEKNNEVADKCRTFHESSEYGPPLGYAPNGSPYNQLIDGIEYLYQQVWSNQASACEQRAAALPAVTGLSPKKGPSGGGTSVTISGSSFSAPATVHFGSVAATSVKVESATSIVAVSPPGAKGTVDVTVTTGAGTSAIVKQDRFKYAK